MQKDIQQTWFFKQPVTQVWDYLTKPELIEQWLAKTDFKPIVGQKFQFSNTCATDDNKPHYTFCRVLQIIPNRLLSYSWRKGTAEDELTLDSVVTWTLVAKNGGTELQLQHNGFTLLDDTLAHTEGWNACLNKITELINTDTDAKTNA